MALFLYFINKPLTTGQLTELVNAELKTGKKRDLRNVSKHVTSKGKSLYGYTLYDSVTECYILSEYGKKWVENELIPTLLESVNEKVKR